jgi:hypothetical protein
VVVVEEVEEDSATVAIAETVEIVGADTRCVAPSPLDISHDLSHRESRLSNQRIPSHAIIPPLLC